MRLDGSSRLDELDARAYRQGLGMAAIPERLTQSQVKDA